MVKISKKQEEEALGLHEKAIVLDACNACFPEDVRRKRAWGERQVMAKYHFPRLLKGGVDSFVTSIAWPHWPWPTPLRVVQNAGHMLNEFDESPDKIVLAKTTKDIEKAKTDGKIAVIFGLQEAQSILGPPEDEFGLLRSLYELGLRVVQITYSKRNTFGDGCYDRSNAGLSDLGVKLVDELNRRNIVVDISHVGERTSMEVIEISKQPVIASHSNVRSLCDHRRNLTDEQIKAIAEKDGVIGMNAWEAMISKKDPSVDSLLDHVDYLAKLVGTAHIGLGLDFYAYAYDVLEEVLYYRSYSKPPRHEHARGIEDETKVPNITQGLVARGYSHNDIEKILGGNFLRVFGQIWK